jgi:hypothetical protein
MGIRKGIPTGNARDGKVFAFVTHPPPEGWPKDPGTSRNLIAHPQTELG